jgi:MbtH protein
MFEDDDELRRYLVVRNDEDQYSIWPDDREPPAGWSPVGDAKSKSECLTDIAELWTDMRPRSARS